MKTRIHRLIDELFVQPIISAITNPLQGGFTIIMDALTDVKQAFDELKTAVTDEHARIDAKLDTLTAQLEAKATEHEDPELTTLAADIRGVTAGLTAFHPAASPNGSGEQTGGQAGDAPPAGSTTT